MLKVALHTMPSSCVVKLSSRHLTVCPFRVPTLTDSVMLGSRHIVQDASQFVMLSL